MISDLDRAYAAGLFEGEGSIKVARMRKANTDTFSLYCAVQMCDLEIPAFFHDVWGGCLWHSKGAASERHRPTHQWQISTRKAARFLSDIQPFLRMERMRIKASVALEFQAQKYKAGIWPASYRQRQRDYYDLMKALNRRGSDSLTNEERMVLAGFENQLVLI